MIQLQKTNKDVLAKLMAMENITVIHKHVPTAYFDVKSRTLCCPILKEDMSSELQDLFMGHEVSHGLNTPAEGWHDAVSEKGMVFKGYLNVIEDVRIEKLIKSKYPGLRKSFYTGYGELADMDFFGTKGKNLQELNLIDRINLSYKIGSFAQIEFSKEEMVYIDRCNKLESFEEVMILADELFERQKNQTDEELESMTQEQLQDLLDSIKENDDIQEGDSTESLSVKLEESEEENDTDGEGSSAKSDDTENTDDSEESDDGESSDGESSDGEETNDITEDSLEGGKGIQQKLEDEMNKSNTDETFRSKEDTLKAGTKEVYEPTYFELPSKLKYKNYVVPFTKIDEIISNQEGLDRDHIQKTVKQFQDDNKKIIGYMVKEFEMKKAASAYNRSWSSKSGEIDMSKIHQYLIKDDIFNRVQVTPEGKNHGVCMILDWSGSMSGSVRATVEQASLLSMFCRRLSIPFRLFAFSDTYDRSSGEWYDGESNGFEYGTKEFEEKNEELRKEHEASKNEKMYGTTIKVDEDKTQKWDLGTVSLLEVFNDKMSNKEFTRSMENWFQLASSIEGRYRDWNETSDYDTQWNAPYQLYLSGTPLDHSLLLMRDYINDFKLDYNLDICSFITLTDGASHRVFKGNKQTLVDRKHNRTFELEGKNGYGRTTHGLLRWLKETTGARTIGFYLKDGGGRDIVWDAQSFCDTKISTYDQEAVDKTKEFKKLSCSFDDGCYDLAILINQKKLKLNYEEDTLQVKEGATKGQLKNALVKAGKNKMIQRVILNQFVGQMAV